jgi:hypothetical protein
MESDVPIWHKSHLDVTYITAYNNL